MHINIPWLVPSYELWQRVSRGHSHIPEYSGLTRTRDKPGISYAGAL